MRKCPSFFFSTWIFSYLYHLKEKENTYSFPHWIVLTPFLQKLYNIETWEESFPFKGPQQGEWH
jgi:hypothetical protein